MHSRHDDRRGFRDRRWRTHPGGPSNRFFEIPRRNRSWRRRIKSALEGAAATADHVDYVIMGHVVQESTGQITAQ
jgi:hypothetical protein